MIPVRVGAPSTGPWTDQRIRHSGRGRIVVLVELRGADDGEMITMMTDVGVVVV